MISNSDLKYLQRCVELARTALESRIVYASSSKQLVQWLNEMEATPSRVRNLSIQEVIRDTIVEGPVPELAEQVRQLHRQFYARKG